MKKAMPEWRHLLADSGFLGLPEVCQYIAWFHEQKNLTGWDHTRYDEARAIIAALPPTPICWADTAR